MVKSLQEIIKEAAERYGLKYDENKQVITVKNDDGTIREVTKEIMEKAFEK